MELAVQELTKALQLMTQLRFVTCDQSADTVRELSEGVVRAIETVLIFLTAQDTMGAEADSAGSVSQTNQRSNKGAKRAHSDDPNPIVKNRRREISTKIITDSPFSDGYQWRKYGQKNIQNTEHPRSYYKCTYHCCDAKKQVQLMNSSYQYEVIFSNEHTCNSTVVPIPQLTLPSSETEPQVISFSSTGSSTTKFSLLDVAKRDNDDDGGLNLIASLSPEGQFYGSDTSAYNGMEETLDLMLPYL